MMKVEGVDGGSNSFLLKDIYCVKHRPLHTFHTLHTLHFQRKNNKE